MKIINRFLPKTKQSWREYLNVFVPVVLAAMLFAFNGFVDNFMVGKYNGVASVSAANQWTSIILGFTFSMQSVGGIVSSQLRHSDRADDYKKFMKLRYATSFYFGLAMAIIVIFIPKELIGIFLKVPNDGSNPLYVQNLDMGVRYLRIISFTWMLAAFGLTLSSLLRETGKAKQSLYFGIIQISLNITLNAIFVYGINYGIEGTAIASIITGTITLMVMVTYVFRMEETYLKVNPIKIFLCKFNSKSVRYFFSKFSVFFTSFSITIFIVFRTYFYDKGFPQDSIAPGIGAMAVIGLSSAIYNIFVTTFSALSIMAANFVSPHIANKKYEEARIVGDELKGFNTLMAFFLSILLLLTSFLIPYMTFLVNSSDPRVDTVAQLDNVKMALWPIALFYPMWIWFSSSIRIGISGDKDSIFVIGDWILTGLQVPWAFLVMVVMKNNSTTLQNNFWVAYLIFFTSDIAKFIYVEIIYYKVDWTKSFIDNHDAKQKKIVSNL